MIWLGLVIKFFNGHFFLKTGYDILLIIASMPPLCALVGALLIGAPMQLFGRRWKHEYLLVFI
jgi:hypothetical protein